MTYVEFNVVKDELRFFIQDDCFLFFKEDAGWTNYKFQPNGTTPIEVVKKYLKSHSLGQVELGLRRKYVTDVRRGNLNVRGQDVLAIDVDRAGNGSVQSTVDLVVETFGKPKFVEYAPDRDRYHLYIQFKDFVTDDDCQAIVDYFASLGHQIEVKKSLQTLRFPMGGRYRVFGFFSRSSAVRVRRASLKRLVQYWNRKSYVIPYPAEIIYFQAQRAVAEVTEPRRQRSRAETLRGLVDDPRLDFGPGERHRRVWEILGKCHGFRLTEEDFVTLVAHHDKGAEGKSNLHKMWLWGLRKWGNPSDRANSRSNGNYKATVVAVVEEINRFSMDTILLQAEIDEIRRRAEPGLTAFIEDKVLRKPMKNPELRRTEFLRRIEALCLFIRKYEVAKGYEFEHLADIEETIRRNLVIIGDILPGVPLSRYLLQALKAPLGISYIPTLVPYLVECGVLEVLPLNPQYRAEVTYAPGHCNYYRLIRLKHGSTLEGNPNN